jgi:tetraacyldisaccharide 4'-kinase
MREPAFWWRAPGVAATLLAPAAAAYGAVAARRLKQTGHRAGVPVLCVGNPTIGGSGKTPAAIAIAKIFLAAGKRPVFLTRGYGGRLAGPIRVDTQSHRAIDVGDEPLLLARVAPTIVSGDRVAGAALAEATGTDVIVMDDGFQNPSLVKDLALLVVDCRRGVGNGRVLPAGPLRAPLSLQLDYADALLAIGDAKAAGEVVAEANDRGLSIFRGRFEPDEPAIATVSGHRVLAFAGIADPGKFFATLVGSGIAPAATASFPDHHRFTAEEAKELLARAEREDLTLLTTEKDLVRMRGEPELADLFSRTRALPVTLKFDKEDAMRRLALSVLKTKAQIRTPSSSPRNPFGI